MQQSDVAGNIGSLKTIRSARLRAHATDCNKQAKVYSNKRRRRRRRRRGELCSPPTPRYSDQRLTRDPAHSQLLIVTRRIWQIIILNNLLPWRPLTLTGHQRPFPRVQICGWEAGFLSFFLFFFLPLCPLKMLQIRDVHYHFNLLFNPFNQPLSPPPGMREGTGGTQLSRIWSRIDVCFITRVFSLFYESLT